MYPPHHLGGYELLWKAAVAAMREAGHEVRVLACDLRLPGERGPEDADVHRELRWYWKDHDFPPLAPEAVLALERDNHAVLGRHLEAFGPDAISWWHMGGMSLSLIERMRRAGMPAIGWIHDDWLVYGPDVDQWIASQPRRTWRRTRNGIPTRVDLGDAARWVFCSDITRRAALTRHPRLPRTGVLHLGVAPIFTPAPERAWEGRIVYVGRIDERKGVGTLIDAVARARELTLEVFGEGDPGELRRLRERAEVPGVAERVAFMGARPRADLPAAYAGADAVVFPVEWSEPYGLVPLEAMAVGRPVVATGRGGSSEYLEDGVNCILYEAGDADALTEALLRLAADAALRARLREGGLATAGRLTERRWTDALVAEHERLTATA